MLSDQEFVFRTAAWATLYVHASIVLFNVFWLVAIPLGVWQGWTFIRNFWWRIAHLVSLAIVAAQVIAGRLCFLTTIQELALQPRRKSAEAFAVQSSDHVTDLLAAAGLGISAPLRTRVRGRGDFLVRRSAGTAACIRGPCATQPHKITSMTLCRLSIPGRKLHGGSRRRLRAYRRAAFRPPWPNRRNNRHRAVPHDGPCR